MLNDLKATIRDIIYPDMVMSIRQLWLLRSLVNPRDVVLEIGSYQGGTTRELSKKAHKIIAMDPFEPYTDTFGKNHDLEDAYKKFKKNIKGRNVVHIKKKSQDALKGFKHKLDFIFIDGEHSYEALVHDTKYLKFLKEGGCFAFHDYADYWHGVKKFIDEKIIGKYKFVAKHDSLIVFKKELLKTT